MYNNPNSFLKINVTVILKATYFDFVYNTPCSHSEVIFFNNFLL